MRDHDAEVGRWVSQNPIQFDAAFDHYAYTNDNPTKLVDPGAIRAEEYFSPTRE